jgi:hypothetical protein
MVTPSVTASHWTDVLESVAPSDGTSNATLASDPTPFMYGSVSVGVDSLELPQPATAIADAVVRVPSTVRRV